MNATTDILRGELERLFDLNELKSLSTELLGLDPGGLDESDSKGAFARSLVEQCLHEDALLALADAMTVSNPEAGTAIGPVFEAHVGEELAAGCHVGGYRILKKLGAGGVGVVYLGERKDDDGESVRVALKLLRADHARNRSASRRWQTGARIIRSIVSPSLAPIMDVGTLEDGRPWIATAFVEGQSLSARIGRTGPMHYNEARPIVCGVLQALERLHEKRIVHGDVKPENVFVVRGSADDRMQNEPTGVLVDAGVDRLFSRSPVSAGQTGLLPIFGTAKAIAPEQARGGRATEATDLYAAACMLYEVLTGKPLFEGQSAIDVIASHLATEPEAPSARAPKGWVSSELDTILLRALSKKSEDRYENAKAFREALESIGRASIPPEARKTESLDSKAFEKAKKKLVAKPSQESLAVALERVVEPAEAWDKAVEVFIELVAKIDALEDKKALLFRIARIQESDLNDAAGAEKSYREILELDSDEEIARVALEELKRHSGDAEGLVELLLEKVDEEEDADTRASILREIAEAYEQDLKDSDSAFVMWVQALAETPRDETLASEVERSAGGNAERWNEAMAIFNETVEHCEDETDKVPLFALMGRWYAEHLGRPDFAQPCFQQALTIDPASESALVGMTALYRKAQTWPELVQVLLHRAESSVNMATARDLKAEAAELTHTKLNNPAKAAELFEAVLDDDPAHPGATRSLEEIYNESGEFKSLVGLLERKAKSERGERRIATLCAIAELYEDRLDDLDQAATHYEGALSHDEGYLPALKGLERIYARTGKFEELASNLREQLKLAATARQKISLHERLGSILLEEFVDHDKAAEHFGLVVELEPGHEGANTALARIYRHLHRFDELAEVLERHALGSEDEERKLGLLIKAAKVLMVEVASPERALTMVEKVIATDPEHKPALELMARLQTQTGDATKALSATDQLAESESDSVKKVELWIRAGKLAEESGDKDAAVTRYKRALDIDPNNSKASDSLRSVYQSRGDAHGAAELIRQQLKLATGAMAQAELHAQLGALQLSRLDEPKEAKKSFLAALELDGTCTPAGQGLGDLAFTAGNFREAAKHYEPLLARTGDMEPDNAREMSVRCGDSFRELGLFEKAQRAYLNAKAFASDDLKVQERVAEVTFESGPADEAAELYRGLLAQFGELLVGSEKGRVLWHLGESLRRAGDLKEAVGYLNDAVELMQDSPEPLDSLAKLHEAQEDWDALVHALRRRMEAAEDDERFELLIRTGDVLMNKAGDKAKASKSYVAALEIRADDRNLLTKLMGLYSENKDWSRLVEVILRIAELVQAPSQLAKYYNTAAAISHYELSRLEEAADYYEQALEHDATMLQSFEGLVTALNAMSDWERLEEAYMGRIARLAKDAEPQDLAHLHNQLGELLLHRLDRKGDGLEALEQAQKLDPLNRQRAEQMAHAYSEEPKRYYQKAVDIHRDLLEKTPYRIESYQALRKLYTEVKKPDESWCVCQALTALKNAEPDEESFYKKHRTQEPAAASRALNAELWGRHIVHSDQDPLLTKIFATIEPVVIATRSQPLADLGIDAGQKRDAENDDADLARMLHYAAGVSGVTLPDVYYRPEDQGGLSFISSAPAAIGLGKGALAGGPGQALAFVAGRHLSYLQPGHYLRMLVPTGGGLRAWLLAAIKTTVKQFPIPADLTGSVDEHLAAFKKHLPGPQQEVLRSLVQKLLAAAPELDMKRWVAAVDLSADRAGFLLSNNLKIAAALIRASGDDAGSSAQKERLKELHLYSVSPDYLGLRQKLGITIGS